jgi:hypothetical protein
VDVGDIGSTSPDQRQYTAGIIIIITTTSASCLQVLSLISGVSVAHFFGVSLACNFCPWQRSLESCVLNTAEQGALPFLKAKHLKRESSALYLRHYICIIDISLNNGLLP